MNHVPSRRTKAVRLALSTHLIHLFRKASCWICLTSIPRRLRLMTRALVGSFRSLCGSRSTASDISRDHHNHGGSSLAVLSGTRLLKTAFGVSYARSRQSRMPTRQKRRSYSSRTPRLCKGDGRCSTCCPPGGWPLTAGTAARARCPTAGHGRTGRKLT